MKRHLFVPCFSFKGRREERKEDEGRGKTSRMKKLGNNTTTFTLLTSLVCVVWGTQNKAVTGVIACDSRAVLFIVEKNCLVSKKRRQSTKKTVDASLPFSFLAKEKEGKADENVWWGFSKNLFFLWLTVAERILRRLSHAKVYNFYLLSLDKTVRDGKSLGVGS